MDCEAVTEARKDIEAPLERSGEASYVVLYNGRYVYLNAMKISKSDVTYCSIESMLHYM